MAAHIDTYMNLNKARLARDAGLSRWTIYRALNPKQGASTESIAKIERAMREQR